MSQSPELNARCEYARYKVLGESHAEHGRIGLEGAEACGFKAYPSERVSMFFVNEPELLAAYRRGWARAQEASRPRSADELKSILDQMDKGAYVGCGQFYELYEQRFTASVNGWIPSLRAGELEIVQELLKSTAYEPHPGGYWEYDQEENDINFAEDSN
jgi:hypothetical protein